MSKTADLKAIERQVYLSYHQDGFIDIFVGILLIFLAVMIWFFPTFLFFLISSLFAFLCAYYAAKKLITIPRMGYVEFSSARRQRIQYVFLVLVVLLVFGNILGIIAMLIPPVGVLIFESTFTILIVGVVGGIIFATIGLASDIRRFYVYGVIFLGSALFTFYFPLILVLPLIAVGLVMTVFGFVLLYGFIRKYPKEELGEMEGA
ncbi:MAG: hypothetical protein ACFFCJ_11940 [Promethearchaeota archaeon]